MLAVSCVYGGGALAWRVVSSSGRDKEQFCASAWPRLVAAMTHYCGDVHLAEEFVQEALVRACRRWGHVTQLESPEGWTYRVAVNLANSTLRRRRIEQRVLRRDRRGAGVHWDHDATDRVVLAAALGELTSRQREAVILRFFLDLSADQAAHLMGTSSGAIRALTHRAVERLREVIDLTGPEEEQPTHVR